MKILHVVPSYIPAWRYGGTIRSVHGLCRALAARGHEVSVYTTDVDGRSRSNVPIGTPVVLDGVRVSYFGSPLPRLYWSPGMGAALARNAGGFDVVHSHSIFLWPTWRAARACRAAGVPHVVSPRGMLVKDLVRRKSRLAKTIWISLIERRTLENAAAVHATSEAEAADIAAFGFRLRNVFVAPNGIDPDADAEPGAAGDDATVADLLRRQPLLVFVGRINWKKGFDRLIPALAHVPNAHLAVVGNDEEGYRPVLDRLARSAGVEHRVTFVGPLRGRPKAALLAGAAVFVLPSYSENFGNAVLDAMAAGCPVAVTPEVGLARAVSETGSGLVLSPHPATMGDELAALLADDGRRRAMGENGRRVARERFSWDAAAAVVENAYREIVKRTEPQ